MSVCAAFSLLMGVYSLCWSPHGGTTSETYPASHLVLTKYTTYPSPHQDATRTSITYRM